jgi:hypothetical protein
MAATAERYRTVDRLIADVTAKLEEHKPVLAHAKSGRLSWRIKDGKVELELEPRL